MKKHLLQSLLAVALLLVCGNVWGESTVLFHESFGKNTNSARAWDDSYSVKSGVAAVYSHVAYTITNAKQGKNTTGQTESGLNQSSQGTDAVFEFGPLNVSSYSNLQLSYYWKAASIGKTYFTRIYYKTTSEGTYTEVSNNASGATTFVNVSVNLPADAQCSTLYLKIVFNTSNTQAIIDEVELTGENAEPAPAKTLTSIAVSGTPTKKEYNVGDTFDPAGLVVTGTYSEGEPEVITDGIEWTVTPNPLTVGTTSVDVTATVGNVTSAAYTVSDLTVEVAEIIFYESFNGNDGTGGNDEYWSGSIASKSIAPENYPGWTFEKAYVANKCAKLGTGSEKGSATTPAISVTGNAVLVFKAAAWNKDGEATTLNLSCVNATLNQSSVTLKKGEWTEYTVDITNAVDDVKIKFESAVESYNRFFLDEVKVILSQTFALTIASSGYSSLCMGFNAAVPDGVTAYIATAADAEGVTLTPIEGVIPAGTGVVVGGAAGAQVAFTERTGDLADVAGNMLVGTLQSKSFDGTEGAYMLKGGQFCPIIGGTLAANKAYLSGITAGAAIELRIGGATMLEQMLQENDDHAIYDLLGRRVENVTKGLYIIGGKKVFVK